MNISSRIKTYLQETEVPLRISAILPSGYPLVVSLWYQYSDGRIYSVSEENAKLVSYLKSDPKCGFEIAADTPPYCGVRGYGDVNIYEDPDNDMLDQLYTRYFTNTNTELYQFLKSPDRRELVIEITPRKLFTWNFEDRMSELVPDEMEKICP